MKKTLFLLIICTLALQANTSLDIYTNKFFISHTFSNSKDITLKVPASINTDDILYKLSPYCSLANEELSETKTLQSKDEDFVKKLQNQKASLEISKKALLSKENLFQSLSLSNEFDTKKIEKLSSYLEKNIIQIETKVDEINAQIEKIEKQLQEIASNKKEYKTLHVSFTCKQNTPITLSYPIKDVAYKAYYEINADTQNNLLTLSSKATLLYNGIENLQDIDINIFSNAYNQNLQPRKFYPQYLQNQEYNAINAKVALIKSSASSRLLQEAMREDLENLYSYTLHNIDVAQNKEISLPLEKENIKADFSYFIDGYGTNKAYTKAFFTPSKTYISTQTKLFLNSIPLGTSYLPKLTKDIPASLYFGENQFVHIKKELIKIENENGFFSGKTSLKEWKYTLSNTSKKPLKTLFVAKVPVSKDADIKVKTIANPAFTNQSAEGKTSWEFTLQPAEVKEIIFGYEISKSK